MGIEIQVITGSTLTDPKEAASYLTGLGRGHILFIDEIHSVPKKVLECFYTALEEGVFQRKVVYQGRSRSFEVALEPFTLIGATTEVGMLPEALISRFVEKVWVEPYPPSELEEIARSFASTLGTSVSPEASRELARRSRGTPRTLRAYLRSARARAQASGRPEIDVLSVLEAMETQGIDEEGLDRCERRVLRYLLDLGRPIGIRAMAAALHMDARTIERVHEPYLLEKGFIARTLRGRVATEKGRRHMARTKAA